MAVIYMPPDPRWQAVQSVGQALGAAVGKIWQERRDEEAIRAASDAMNPQSPNAPAPGSQPQMQQPDLQSQMISPSATPSATPTTGGPVNPQLAPEAAQASASGAYQPDFGRLARAMATASPAAKQSIMMMLSQRAEAHKEALQERQFEALYQQRSRQFGIEEKRLAQTAQHQQTMEEQGQERIGIETQRVGIEGSRAAAEITRAKAELALMPLKVEALKTNIMKGKETLLGLQQEQASLLKPDELQKMAANYAATGFKNPPNFGWGGAVGMANRVGFWRAVNDLPLTPAQRNQMQTAYNIQQHEGQVAGRTLANLDININKADQLMRPINQGLEKLTPVLTKSPMFNRFKRAVLTGVGDPAFSGMDVYVRSFLTAYGKSMNPNGTLSVHFDEEVSRLLDTISSPEQLIAKLQALNVDMGLEREAVKRGTSDITRAGSVDFLKPLSMGDQGATGPTSGAAGANPDDDDPLGILK